MAAVGCSESPPSASSDEGNITSASATSVDLQEFRTVAIEKIRAVVGGGPDLENGTIVFEDGVSNLDEAAFDHATLYYVVDLPTLTPIPGAKFAYSIGLNGVEETKFGTFVSADDFQPLGNNLTVTINDEVFAKPAAERKQVIDGLVSDLQKECPKATIDSLENVGIVILTSPLPSELVGATRVLGASPIVKAAEMPPSLYKLPYQFDPLVNLGDGKASKVVDLVSLTKTSKELRKEGQQFSTLPSLPAPFGPGPKLAP